MVKTAIITGATGQDASYLADLLLSKNYKVVGISRRRSNGGDDRIKHLYSNPNFVYEQGDITDSGSITRIVKAHQPDEFYNLAAQSHVGISFKEPYHTGLVTGLGVVVCLEVLRNEKPDTRFYQASSSEMFGKVKEVPQNEETKFHPRSPYGCAKVNGYWLTRNYRESYDMFCSNGILFNHESPRRGLEFVTRKITDAAARIKVEGGGVLELGSLEPRRDWGHAKDYMYAAWLMLQHNKPDDFVISTGRTHSIKRLLEVAFGYVDLDWSQYVVQNPKFIRPAEVDILIGDSSKARKELGWKPRYDFMSLIEEMVESDLKRYNNG